MIYHMYLYYPISIYAHNYFRTEKLVKYARHAIYHLTVKLHIQNISMYFTRNAEQTTHHAPTYTKNMISLVQKNMLNLFLTMFRHEEYYHLHKTLLHQYTKYIRKQIKCILCVKLVKEGGIQSQSRIPRRVYINNVRTRYGYKRTPHRLPQNITHAITSYINNIHEARYFSCLIGTEQYKIYHSCLYILFFLSDKICNIIHTHIVTYLKKVCRDTRSIMYTDTCDYHHAGFINATR
jgi:hypothetical protein